MFVAMNTEIKAIFLSLLLLLSTSNAQTTRKISIETKTKQLPFGLIKDVPKNKPVIGLALSGGGARGFAQVGVLKALIESGINIDFIAGTSMGSIVGGLYAAGYSVTELDSIAVNTDWDMLLSLNETASRRELFIDQKITEDRAIFTLRLDGFKPIIPTAFNDGLRLSNYLAMLTLKAPIQPKDSFDDLFVRYRAVCTDLISGDPVNLDSGSLSRAMRASSSVTFYLSPVEWGTLTLVDGGLVANVPVDVAKKNGSDLIIAVNTTSPLRKEEELNLPWNIADQTVSIPMKLLVKEQLSKANIVIQPELQEWSAIDFSFVDSLIPIGYLTAVEQINEITVLVDSAYRNNLTEKEYFIKNVHFAENVTVFEKQQFDEFLSMDSVSNYDLSFALCKLYETGRYKTLSMELFQTGDSSKVKLVKQLNPLVKSVQISGTIVSDSIFQKSFSSELIGKHYNMDLVLDGIIEVLKFYRGQGYLLTNFEEYNFEEKTGKLELYFNIGTISEIKIKSETNEALIKRELIFKEGDYFLYEEVKRGLKNLRSTNLFKDIDITVEITGNKNVIYINTKERISNLLKVGFLVDNVYNAQLSIDLRDVNLLGTGTELGLFLFGGASNRAYIAEHIAHRIFNTYLTYKINAYYKFNDINVYNRELSSTGNTYDSDKIGKYRQIFYGASLSLGTQIEKFGKLIFTGKYQFDEVKNKEGNVVNPYKTKIVSLKIGATIDDQNKYPYPDDGLYFDGFYETAQSFLGGDEGYIVAGMDFNYFLSLGTRHVLKPRLMLGFGDRTLPLSEQFIIGGQYTFFGFHENELKGRQVFLTSFMYQYKLPFKIFFDTYFWFRYDIGSTWEEQEQIRFKDLKHGIGGTLSFETPIGPADFSIGRSFIPRKELPENPISWGEVLFYFSIGHAITF
jgi:NTE family protein